MSQAGSTETLLQTLRDAGAARLDAVGWHYIETLAARIGTQTGPVQRLLQDKLRHALSAMQARLTNTTEPPQRHLHTSATPSPLALLLQEMAPAATPAPAAAARQPSESPRVRQFRKQLHKISVQKQVSRAMAQAPRNAGPINSHMLVLRALGLMRDISPDYLNRFMAQVDTLLCLEDAEKNRVATQKNASGTRIRSKSRTVTAGQVLTDQNERSKSLNTPVSK